jgi:alkylation response protein AidB-like acyl-CoA dehydrogenase
MTMLLTSEQRMLADSIGDFLARRAPVSHLRALRDAGEPAGFDRTLWRDFATMGFNGVLAAEGHGGLGLGHVEAGMILEAIGRNLTPTPFLSSAVGAATALASASPTLGEAWLPGIVAGEAVVAIALEESVRHRPDRIALAARRHGGAFVLRGEKRFVVHGHAADALLVVARDSSGVTLFVVDAQAEGLRIEAERLVDAGVAARLRFEDVAVPAEAAIEGTALGPMLAALYSGAAAELVGLAGRAMEITLDYVGERRQFGKPIGSFQALQHRAAHCHAEIETARAAVLKAQILLDAGDAGAPRAAVVAKGMAGLASALAVQEAVQMHGGIGMTDEHDIGLFMKRQRVLAELWGDADYHADRLARMSGY